jgi:hypothetical protein
MKKPTNDYEPAFGGMVFVLAAALLCTILYTAWNPGVSATGTVFLSIMCVNVMTWGASKSWVTEKRVRDSSTHNGNHRSWARR